MFYILSKILTFITDPLFWITVLFVFAFISRKRSLKRIFFWGAVILVLLLGNGALVTWAERQWINNGSNSNNVGNIYEYALIQGGFGTYNPATGRTQLNPAAERLIEPIRLYNLGKVRKLFITGDGSFTDQEHPESKQIFREYLAALGVASEDIVLDAAAKNTYQSAVRTKELLGNHFRAENSLLVTDAIHMPRTLACYKKEGMQPVSYPTSVPKPYRFSLTTFSLSSKNLDRWQMLIHEWVGIIAYKVAGYI